MTAMCFAAAGAAVKPEWLLAVIIERELGVKIDPMALRMFVRAHWKDVAPLAHAIHGKTEETTNG